jgi:hypothetical protein
MHITDFNKGARTVLLYVFIYLIGEDPQVARQQSLCPFQMYLFNGRLPIVVDKIRNRTAGYRISETAKDSLLLCYARENQQAELSL